MQGMKQMSFAAIVVLSIAATTASCSQTANLEDPPKGRGSRVATAPASTDTAAPSTSQSSSTQAAAAAGSADAQARGGQAFKRALDRLGAARTAVYRVDLVMKDGAVRLSDEVATDVPKGIVSHRVHKRAIEAGRAFEAYLRVVTDAEGHGWEVTTDDAGRPVSTWQRVDTAQEAMRLNRVFGVLVYPGTPSVIAAGVESISVLGADAAGHRLSGTMPGDSAVALLGFPEASEQLDAMIEGNAPVRVQLADDGSIDTVVVVGAGHTIKTDVNQLPTVVSSLMSSTVTTIRYLSVGSPASVPLPPALRRAHP